MEETTEAQREGRRERRARETRRRILLAAFELFSERGVDAVTIEEIADRADVARGTIFNHFATKESLCHNLGELEVEAVQEAIEDGRLGGATAGEKIAGALRLMAEFPGKDAEHCRAVVARGLSCLKPGELPEHRRQLFGLFESWVREGQSSGEFRADVPSCELAGFIMGLQLQATIAWAYGFAPGSLADRVTRVLQFALEGIRSEQAIYEGRSGNRVTVTHADVGAR